MFKKEYALLNLFEKATQIDGRKKLQKIVYLLKLYKLPFEMNYKYYHYGPYSAELQTEINYLVSHGLLDELPIGEMYVYRINNKGYEFLKSYRKMIDDDFEIPENLLNELLDCDTSVLEMASTYAYLLEMGYGQEEAYNKAVKLKPYLEYCFDEAKTVVEQIMQLPEQIL